VRFFSPSFSGDIETAIFIALLIIYGLRHLGKKEEAVRVFQLWNAATNAGVTQQMGLAVEREPRLHEKRGQHSIFGV
jgi:hypothetical protein